MSLQVQSENVVVEAQPRIKVLHFAVELPPSAMQGYDEPSPRTPVPSGDSAVVGTITLLNKSAMVWFGWGRIQQQHADQVTANGVPTMGQMVVAMPRTKYKGAFAHESSCSQLVGGQEEDEIMGGQMATRLSQRLGYPIFVSCSLSSGEGMDETLFSGLDSSTVAQRAAALAEREVARLLQKNEQ